MNSRRLLSFCLAAGLATATAPALAQPEPPPIPPIWTPTPSPTSSAAATAHGPAASIDPAQTARARAEFDAWRSGTIDRSHYESPFVAKISDADIGQVAAHLRALGTIASFTQLQHASGGGGSNYFIYKIVGSAPPPVVMLIAFDAAGKIDNIAFQPMEVTSPSPAPTP
jgi:hypothetical protein